jgi:protein-S-isoprenylcysteine O-methyltransferase Ste14
VSNRRSQPPGRRYSLSEAVGHHLVTEGIYGRIRHPIYASLLLWGAAQVVLLQNAVAGWGGAAAAVLVWVLRVPAEEKMMVDAFGDEYRRYMTRTGRVLPRVM